MTAPMGASPMAAAFSASRRALRMIFSAKSDSSKDNSSDGIAILVPFLKAKLTRLRFVRKIGRKKTGSI